MINRPSALSLDLVELEAAIARAEAACQRYRDSAEKEDMLLSVRTRSYRSFSDGR